MTVVVCIATLGVVQELLFRCDTTGYQCVVCMSCSSRFASDVIAKCDVVGQEEGEDTENKKHACELGGHKDARTGRQQYERRKMEWYCEQQDDGSSIKVVSSQYQGEGDGIPQSAEVVSSDMVQ